MQVLITWSDVGENVPHDYDALKEMLLIDKNKNVIEKSDYNQAKLMNWLDEHDIDEPIDVTQMFEKQGARKPVSSTKMGRYELSKLKGISGEIE